MLTGTSVLGTLTIPGQERNVSQARDFVGQTLGAAHPQLDVACLLVSELVTNAVQHSDSRCDGGTVTVIIVDLEHGVRVDVIDNGSSRTVPVVRNGADGADGRGLFLVGALAADWGYRRGEGVTTVWFRLVA